MSVGQIQTAYGSLPDLACRYADRAEEMELICKNPERMYVEENLERHEGYQAEVKQAKEEAEADNKVFDETVIRKDFDDEVVDSVKHSIRVKVITHTAGGVLAGAAIGAGIGAVAGIPAGPPGMAIGAVVGGVIGGAAGGYLRYQDSQSHKIQRSFREAGIETARFTISVSNKFEQWRKQNIQALLKPMFQDFLSNSKNVRLKKLAEYECVLCNRVSWLPVNAPDGKLYDQDCIMYHLKRPTIAKLPPDHIERSPFRVKFEGTFTPEDIVLNKKTVNLMLRVSCKAIAKLEKSKRLSETEESVLKGLRFYSDHMKALIENSLEAEIETIVTDGVEEGLKPDAVAKMVKSHMKDFFADLAEGMA